jgi:hypothetical protein
MWTVTANVLAYPVQDLIPPAMSPFALLMVWECCQPRVPERLEAQACLCDVELGDVWRHVRAAETLHCTGDSRSSILHGTGGHVSLDPGALPPWSEAWGTTA